MSFYFSLKVLIYFCIIMIVMTGVVLAAERNFIVGFNKPNSEAEKKVEIESYNGIVEKYFHMINAVSVKVPEEKIDAMKKNPKIKYVVNNTVYKMSDEYSNSWGVQYIGSQNVHNQNINGTGVNISVLDTGIDYYHNDLKDNYKGGYDFVFGDTDPWDDNCLSYYKTCHGTHVSGIIAAESNGIGIIGVAPGSNIYAVKVLDSGGFGTADMIISGIEWSMSNGLNIISMSLQSPENNTALLDAINAAYSQGILIVAAAGNTNGGNVSYPAAYDNVIAVTAINQNAQRASFSPIDPKIELAAPGVNIYSTVQGGYAYLSGTSMSAPYVTGVAALINSTDYPDVNGDGIRNSADIRKILQDSALDVGIAGRDDIYGYGIVDPKKAIFGYSDISTIIDDGISNITAGDGNLYNYTITVRNNGPAYASNVKLLDSWPVGFIRNTIISTQGTCDTSINFTCDLGDIANGNTATIIAQYSVPSTVSAGNYTNYVEAHSTNIDYNNLNNSARDIDKIDIFNVTLNLVRSNSKCKIDNLTVPLTVPLCDAKNISLVKGNYSIIINNVNLTKMDVLLYKDREIQRYKSYILDESQVVNFIMNINSNSDVIFVPYGNKGSKGQVTIRRI